jgi:hypothetical protein
MAIIIPFADPNAHGSVANAYSFRRYYNKVVYQKKPHPVQPDSAGQLAQRAAFSAASDAWYALNVESKLYYNTRGSQLGMNGRNLYIKAALLGILPSTTPLYPVDAFDMQIQSPASSNTTGFIIIFNAEADQLGSIYDNQNSFIDDTYVSSEHNGDLNIYAVTDPSLIIPFRYCLYLRFNKYPSVMTELYVRLPELPNAWFSDYFYLSDDGSVFWDSGLTKLAATPNF